MLTLSQNIIYGINVYYFLFHKFLDGNTTILRDKVLNLVNETVISTCWRNTRMCSTFHRCAVIYTSLLPLINFGDDHGIVAENLLNLHNGSISSILCKKWCDSAALINNEITSNSHYTFSLKCWLPTADTIYGRGKKFTVPCMFLPEDTKWTLFVISERKVGCFLYSHCILGN